MKKIVFLSIIIFTNIYLFAQVDITGNLETKTRFGFTGEDRITWNRNILSLNFSSNITERAGLFSDLRFTYDAYPKGGRAEDYIEYSTELTQPLVMELREAFVDLYGFPLHNVDIRIGKQRIAWGTADKFNPTDNINPDKLDDIYEFGDHFGSTAFNLKWYLGQITTQLIYTPTFTPAILPKGEWINAFINYNLPDSLLQQFITNNPLETLGYIDIDNRIKNTSSFALKISTTLFGYDLSVSYFTGREDIPVLNYDNLLKYLSSSCSYPTGFCLGSLFTYPKKSVLGFDFAGSIRNFGIWGEFAYTDMEKIFNPQKIIEAGGKFTKYVLGFDYTTTYNLYINFQYIHGFLHEMTKDNLNDYFAFRLEKDFPYKNFKIILLSGLASISDWDNIKKSYGFSMGPGLQLRPSDGVELNLGIYIIDAKPGSFFYNVKDLDEVYLNIKYSF